ncbi:hypothetical protein Tco_0891155 [Tanacetum coccineum]|uniref:Replication protein A OB domain-containing protein n=1 Tax=Tanacetum coccineum TaxID=301880 RepID=A0ABQ5C3P5_9ASTR
MATVGVVVAVGGVVAWWWQREMEVTRMGVRWDGDGCDEGGGEVCRLLAGGGAAEVVTWCFWCWLRWGGRSGGSVMEDSDDGSGDDSRNLAGKLVEGRPEKERREWGLDYLGCIRSIGDITPFGDANKGQSYWRKVDIESLDGNIVEFTMWDELAKQFNKED